jgi:hypothetical protein
MIRVMTATAVAVAALALGAGSAAVAAPVGKHFEGTVVSKNKQAKTFRLQNENGVTRRFKVNASTVYERLAGFGAIKRGQRLETIARKRDGRWIASKVSRPGGGGGGQDDGPNHT